MKRFTIILLLAFLVCFVNAQEKLDLYLLIGQSNMAGRGVVEAQDTLIFEHVLTLTEDLKWKPAQDPIHFDKEIAGVGLGRTFGIEMHKVNPGKKIGLIPCAVGGSPIGTWKPNAIFMNPGIHPWDDMVKRLEFTLEQGELKGVLWHQGEADSKLELAPYYGQKLTNNPDLPVVVGEMLKSYQSYNGKPFKNGEVIYPKMVTKATKLIAKADENIKMVSSKGLKDKGDQVHFDSQSYRELGKRYAKAMQKLQKK